MCNYFVLCDNHPNGMVEIGAIGRVETCTRCATKMEQELLPFTEDEALLFVHWLEDNDQNTFAELVMKASDERHDLSDVEREAVDFEQYMAYIIRNDNQEVLS